MITYLEQIGSTNDWMKERIDVLSHGDAVTAKLQTAGKGRLGRTWESKAGEGMYLSVMLLPEKAEDFLLIPLICGLAVCNAGEKLCNAEFMLKWPNDIILCEKKVGGILCEGRNGRAVCGIGVNLRQDKAYFDEKLLVNGASLKMLGKTVPDSDILAEYITDELISLYDMYCKEGKSFIIDMYKSKCVTLGREVIACSTDREVSGIAKDVDADGCLVIETAEGMIKVNSGEVKLRLLNGNYV